MIDLAQDIEAAMGRAVDPLTETERANLVGLLRRVRQGVQPDTYGRKGSSPRLRDELSKAPPLLRQQIREDIDEGERVRGVVIISADPPVVDVVTDRTRRETRRHALGRVEITTADIDETDL